MEVFDCRSCDARHAQVRSSVVQCIMCSAHAGKIEITRKKKRVDSCGMLVRIDEHYGRAGAIPRAGECACVARTIYSASLYAIV